MNKTKSQTLARQCLSMVTVARWFRYDFNPGEIPARPPTFRPDFAGIEFSAYSRRYRGGGEFSAKCRRDRGEV